MTKVEVIFCIMKRIFSAIFAIAALALGSCSNKVDLYTDDGEHTIIYSIIDAEADTNFVKITKSFVGNAQEMAQNYDNSNYKYDDIDVKFSGVFEGNNNIQTVQLDTISKWIPSEEGSVFYSGRRQTYYYLKNKAPYKLKEGETYTITVKRKSDGAKITAKTKTINTFRYRKPLSNYIFNFDSKKFTIEWAGEDVTINFMTTAAYFEICAYFHFTEQMPGSTEEVSRSIAWPLGSDKAENLFRTSGNTSFYALTFNPESIYTVLRNNDYLKNNSPYGVRRYFEDFEIKISAIGEELYNYYIITNSTSAIQDVPNYTNVDNGYGLVSSRVAKSTFHKINQTSRQKIADDFPQYGFIYDPNR